MTENSSTGRFTRFSNLMVNYDYKCGHYLGIWDQLYPSLMLSFIEVSRGIRKAPWYFSDQYNELFMNMYKNYQIRFVDKLTLQLADVENWYSSHVTPVDNFFNTFTLLQNNNGLINTR